MKKYNIIYADPPWDVKAGPKQGRSEGDSTSSNDLVYHTMLLDEIKDLPVKQMADKNAVLFLWTINKYLEQSYSVARCWGFRPSTMLVWTKTPKGLGLGGTFTLSSEYLLFARKGDLKSRKRISGNHWYFPRRRQQPKAPFF